ncbi:hypothetical protein Ais01nite_58300 [Asanoa ishikariensis]|nr:hypothetical protein Ais01nite_58300 [Asanoa ishikariensis]
MERQDEAGLCAGRAERLTGTRTTPDDATATGIGGDRVAAVGAGRESPANIGEPQYPNECGDAGAENPGIPTREFVGIAGRNAGRTARPRGTAGGRRGDEGWAWMLTEEAVQPSSDNDAHRDRYGKDKRVAAFV